MTPCVASLTRAVLAWSQDSALVATAKGSSAFESCAVDGKDSQEPVNQASERAWCASKIPHFSLVVSETELRHP